MPLEGTESTIFELQTKANFASMEAGAVILGFFLSFVFVAILIFLNHTCIDSTSKLTGVSNLLIDSKDKYAINPCSEDFAFVIGLSEDVCYIIMLYFYVYTYPLSPSFSHMYVCMCM